MKQTIDGVSQHPRMWYYLLDFNDADNWQTIEALCGKSKLHELTDDQFRRLFMAATTKDNIGLIQSGVINTNIQMQTEVYLDEHMGCGSDATIELKAKLVKNVRAAISKTLDEQWGCGSDVTIKCKSDLKL